MTSPQTVDVICIGHAALDRVYRVGEMPSGPGKLRALEYIESGGGMAANAAAAVARLGARAALWSRVGEDDAGVRIRRGLELDGVDIRNVQRVEDARSSTAAIIVDQRGERMIITARDINMPSDTSWLPLETIADSKVVLADSRWLEAVRVSFARAREITVPTVLDADLGGREALPELLALTDYAIFSEPALADFLPKMELKDRLDRVMLYGPRHVGVTRGADGYVWRDTFGGGSVPAFNVNVVDTTGAGDAFHGAFALGIAEGLSAERCARFACAVAALKCTRLGARNGLPERAAVTSLMSGRDPSSASPLRRGPRPP